MSKFDQFIENYDKKLNVDTSTISTLSSPTESHFDRSSISASDEPISKPSTPNLNLSSATTLKPNTQSTPTKSHKNSVSYHPLSPILNSSQNQNQNGVTNTGSSRKKGLNLNIAMSSKNSTPKKQALTKETNNESDMNDVLRKMASSEIKIIELKDELKIIQQKIQLEDEELTRLRAKVVQNMHQPKNRKPESPSKSIKSHQSTSSTSSTSSQTQDPINQNQSYWSKPMNLLNQFDQLLQNEFEKIGKDSMEKDDVLKGVSNSLWGFLGDVKSGLMGDDEQTSQDSHSNTQVPKQKQQQEKRKSIQKSIQRKGKEVDDKDDIGLGTNKIEIQKIQGTFNGSEEELIDITPNSNNSNDIDPKDDK